MITESKHVIAVPPGETIKEQITDRCMTQKEFAARMGMSEKHISNLINGSVELTPETAVRLESVLGIPAAFWNTLEANYRSDRSKAEEENRAEEERKILRDLPVKEMIKNGWIKPVSADWDKILELRNFFEVSTLTILTGSDSFKHVCFRRLSNTEKSNWIFLTYWQKARLESRYADVSDINLSKLKKSLNQIKQRFVSGPDMDRLRDLFASCGISFVVLPNICGSYTQGASFYDGKKIILLITARKKDADIFLFSLFHEIGHILLGHLGKDKSEETEKEADSFAEQTLIDRKKFEEFANSGDLTEKAIVHFSELSNVDPGVTVGRLQKYGFIKFNCFNYLKHQISF